MKKIAVVDIDNTLWQFCDVFYAHLKKLHAEFPPVDQWTTPDFFLPYCSEQEFLAAVNAIHFTQDDPGHRPYPESRQFLLVLKEQGFHVIIASHRLTETRVPTERWLSRHRLPYDELHLSFDKTVLFGDAAIVVDDVAATLEKAVARGARGAGLLFPWNQAYTGNGFGLFRDLDQVLGYVLREHLPLADPSVRSD